MGISAGPNSISDSLAFHIDPANPRSYAGVGTVIYDMSGNGKTSYFTNGAFYQNYQKGVVAVDGNNDYISTPLFNLTSPITVSAWVKNVSDDAPVFSASGDGVNYGNNEVIHYFSGKSILIAGNPTAGKYFQFPQLNLNQWSHLVMTRDTSNNMSVYLNGIGSTSNTQSYSNTLQMNQIGRYSAFTNIYNIKGSIGEVKIYNRALSATEVLQNYNASRKKYLPEENIVKNGLVLNIDAANPSSYVGSGNNAFDLSGFGNTATLVNGTGFGTTGGGMFVFDGSNDYIDIPSITSITGNFTVAVWFFTTATTDANFKRLVDLNYATGFWLGRQTNTNNWGGGIIESNEPYGIYLPLTNGQWHYLVSIRSGSTHILYGDGVSNTISNTVSTGNLSASSLLIAKQPEGGGTFLNGNISQVQLYNRALSATEVMQNFNAMRERYNI
jgi:hypothetical protein